MTVTTEPPTVTLDHWHDRVYGDRWTLIHEGRSVLTFGTEFEARQAARRYGWIVMAAPDTEVFQ